MYPQVKILVPIDFSERSIRSLDQALRWTRRAQGELHVLHVVTNGHKVPHESELAHGLLELRRLVDQALRGPRGRQPDEETLAAIECHVVLGYPPDAILEAARRLGIDLIFLGGTGKGGHPVLGSVATHVVSRARCPVACLGSGAPPFVPTRDWDRIVCPIDFSDCAHAALHVAADLAGSLGLELVLLHVQAPEEEREGTVASLYRWVALARSAGAAHARSELLLGAPAEEILRFVREGTDLVVMGTHGHGGIGALLMGSVAHAVLRQARGLVLTIGPETIHAGAQVAHPGESLTSLASRSP